MKAPFSAGFYISSGNFTYVTVVCKAILSKGKPYYLAVVCIIAVKKLIGLKRYEIHKE